jgi:hypothetical protein
MSSLSVLVVPAENGRARFVVERNGVWQDGDLGLRAEWLDVANTVFAQFTAFLQVNQPLAQVWLRAQCRDLYKYVLPDATKKILTEILSGVAQNAVPALYIYSYPVFDIVPWELMHDGFGYLGVRYQIARMPIVPQPPAPTVETRSVASIFHMLGRGVVNLPGEQQLFTDWLNTFQAPSAQAFPSSTTQPAWPTLDIIEKACGADILHLTCHGLANGWTLDQNAGDPSLISGTFVDYVDLKDGKPLVFANACNPANGQAALTPGLAHRFISRGTLNVIGTFAPVTRNLAIEFARKFYSILLTPLAGEPVTIAEAIRQTKEHFHNIAAQQPANAAYDPSYLFYCLYGTANSRFKLAGANGVPQ